MTRPDDPARSAPPRGVPDDLPHPTPNEMPKATGDESRGAPRDDAAFDAALRAAGRQYRVPPAVPADAMWTVIAARRADRRSPARVVRVSRGRDLLRAPAWRAASLAAAAALFVAVGVGIGRHTGGTPSGVVTARPATAAMSPGSSTMAPAPMRSPSAAPEVRASRGRAPEGSVPRGIRVARGPAAAHTRPDSHGAAVDGALADRALADRTPAAGADVGDAVTTSAPLRVAADQHFVDAEALLTAFASQATVTGAPAAAPDSAWARDLLTTTRLLLDSPAGRDPARRALLDDLELVLAQIARLPHADTPAERALIARAIRRGDLLAKLRTGVPARPQPVARAGSDASRGT